MSLYFIFAWPIYNHKYFIVISDNLYWSERHKQEENMVICALFTNNAYKDSGRIHWNVLILSPYLCCVRRCLDRLPVERNFFPQTAHSKLHSLTEQVTSWCFIFDLLLKPFKHFLHLCGRRSIWLFVCICKWFWFMNPFPQTSHTCEYFLICLHRCIFKLYFVLNDLSQFASVQVICNLSFEVIWNSRKLEMLRKIRS